MSAETSPDVRRESRGRPNVVLWATVSAVGVVLAGAVLLIALCLVSWATDRPEGAGPASAARVATQAWYLAHSVALPASWGSLSVPPLLITGFIALLFYRAGRSTARSCELTRPGEVAEALAATVITYVTCAILFSSIAYPDDPMLSITQIVIGAGSISLLATLAGLLRESGLGARIVAALPGPSYAYGRAALAAYWALGGMSALVVAASLLLNFSETSALTGALAPDGLGGLSIIGISIAYLPNAMLLATALGTGAGFTLGGDSAYGLTSVDRESLPIFPLFGALPHDGGGLTLLVVLVPLAAGVVGALTLTRHLEPDDRTATNLLAGSAAFGLATGVGVFAVAAYAAGSLGDGRLSVVGAPVWATAIRAALVIAVSGAVTAFVATRRSLKPMSVARRERQLAVLQTERTKPTRDASGSDAGDDASEAAPEGADDDSASEAPARRPVILTRLAMRRLMRGGKRAARVRAAKAVDGRRGASGTERDESGVAEAAAGSHTAPAATLSVVKKARAAREAAKDGEAAPPGEASATTAATRAATKSKPAKTAKLKKAAAEPETADAADAGEASNATEAAQPGGSEAAGEPDKADDAESPGKSRADRPESAGGSRAGAKPGKKTSLNQPARPTGPGGAAEADRADPDGETKAPASTAAEPGSEDAVPAAGEAKPAAD